MLNHLRPIMIATLLIALSSTTLHAASPGAVTISDMSVVVVKVGDPLLPMLNGSTTDKTEHIFIGGAIGNAAFIKTDTLSIKAYKLSGETLTLLNLITDANSPFSATQSGTLQFAIHFTSKNNPALIASDFVRIDITQGETSHFVDVPMVDALSGSAFGEALQDAIIYPAINALAKRPTPKTPDKQGQYFDSDNDGVEDDIDNCRFGYNPGQDDIDNDSIGNVCDNNAKNDDAESDFDSDGVSNAFDNCPSKSNSNQNDTDHDGFGDICDPCPNDFGTSCLDGNATVVDTDKDGVADWEDNCVSVSNDLQEDFDGDGIGDLCDVSNDLGGVPGSKGAGACTLNPTTKPQSMWPLMLLPLLILGRRRFEF